ncbi:hypothetical protein H310_12009 [Aphanomyces invadans]|uniref:Uncharacterized protein n=1 Tax=Aphanomyces invadans TaxID=157072 RepID=A0A024TL86_9STRA|nr:hypothetical protein H310_12009 [Aphanomyces invadans]ETV94371.1 hypothetical protein H310_12009 [Aphanomyces invadans]|eukprot:XP_008877133.1 hypothetical protein H310_12009 [Aphanomyces invadans]
MVDHRGRIRARQISIVNTRCRLHSPLYRNTRSTISTSSRSSVEEYEESRLVRSPSRSPTRVVQRQVFFGDDYADTDSDYPMKEVDFHATVVKPNTLTDFVRTTTTTTTKTVVCEEQMHLESEVETNTSSVAMDNAWEVSTADMKRRSTADSAPCSEFSASPCERKKSRYHAQYARPTFSSALAQSTGMSDALARMKLRKQEVEMANVVDKVQKQMMAMESVLKELQLEHRVKCELLERQIEMTNRVEQEKTALQHELDVVTRQLMALQSRKEGETTQNVNYLSVAMTAFMNQSEQAQNLMLNQLKALNLPQLATETKESKSDVLHLLTKYHEDVLSALKSTASTAHIPEVPTPVRRSMTLATEAPMPKALPLAKTKEASNSSGFTSQRMIGALIFCLGVGGGLLVPSSSGTSPAPVVQAPLDVDVIVEKLKQVYVPSVAPSTETKWAEVVASVDDVVEAPNLVEPVVDEANLLLEQIEEESKPAFVKDVADVPLKEAVASVATSVAVTPDVSTKIALIMKLKNLKKPSSQEPSNMEQPSRLNLMEVEVLPLVTLAQKLNAPALNASLVDAKVKEAEAESHGLTEDADAAPVTAEAVGESTVVSDETIDQVDAAVFAPEVKSVVDMASDENSPDTTYFEAIAPVEVAQVVVPVEVNAIKETADEAVPEAIVEVVESVSEVETILDEVAEMEPATDVSDVAEKVSEAAPMLNLPKSSFDALAMALRSLIDPSQKEPAAAVQAPKASLTKAPLRSSGRHLWKRNVKPVDVALPLEVVASASFVGTDEIELLESVAAVSPDADNDSVVGDDETVSFGKAASPELQFPLKVTWADKVYANISSEIAADTKALAALEVIVPKPSLFSNQRKLDLPTCAWNTSVAAEVSWNPFYNAMTFDVDPFVTADSVDGLIAVDVDEDAVVADAPLVDALVATTADASEQVAEEVVAVDFAQQDNNSIIEEIEVDPLDKIKPVEDFIVDNASGAIMDTGVHVAPAVPEPTSEVRSAVDVQPAETLDEGVAALISADESEVFEAASPEDRQSTPEAFVVASVASDELAFTVETEANVEISDAAVDEVAAHEAAPSTLVGDAELFVEEAPEVMSEIADVATGGVVEATATMETSIDEVLADHVAGEEVVVEAAVVEEPEVAVAAATSVLELVSTEEIIVAKPTEAIVEAEAEEASEISFEPELPVEEVVIEPADAIMEAVPEGQGEGRTLEALGKIVISAEAPVETEEAYVEAVAQGVEGAGEDALELVAAELAVVPDVDAEGVENTSAVEALSEPAEAVATVVEQPAPNSEDVEPADLSATPDAVSSFLSATDSQ